MIYLTMNPDPAGPWGSGAPGGSYPLCLVVILPCMDPVCIINYITRKAVGTHEAGRSGGSKGPGAFAQLEFRHCNDGYHQVTTTQEGFHEWFKTWYWPGLILALSGSYCILGVWFYEQDKDGGESVSPLNELLYRLAYVAACTGGQCSVVNWLFHDEKPAADWSPAKQLYP